MPTDMSLAIGGITGVTSVNGLKGDVVLNYDLREFGTVTPGSAIDTAFDAAITYLLTTVGGDTVLELPISGTFQINSAKILQTMNGSAGISFIGSTPGSTNIRCQSGAGTGLFFGIPAVDGTTAAGSTTTAIVATAAVFTAGMVGGRLTTTDAGGTKIGTTITAFTDSTHITLSPPLSAAPAIGVPLAVHSQGRRNQFGARFRVDGNNVANYPMFVGRGASHLYTDIRVTDALKDCFVFEGTQNWSCYNLDATGANESNLAITRSAKNGDFYSTLLSTAGLSQCHLVERGLSHVNGSDTPEKINFIGGIMEQDDTAGTYVATVWGEDGDLVTFTRTTLTGGATNPTPVIRLQRTRNFDMNWDLRPSQVRPVGGGYALDTGGGTSGKPINVYFGPRFVSSTTQAQIQARDNNVNIGLDATTIFSSQPVYANHPLGTATLTQNSLSETARKVPTLIFPKPTTDTPDDDFNTTALASKWVVVTGSSGTVDVAETGATVSRYDTTSSPGRLQLQVGSNSGQFVRLRQDYTIPDLSSIVAKLTLNLNMYTGGITPTNDEQSLRLVLNGNDSQEHAGTSYLEIGLTTLGSVKPYVTNGITQYEQTAVYPGTPVTVRIVRSGLNYRGGICVGDDLGRWLWSGVYTPAVAYNNIWLVATNAAGTSAHTPLPIHVVEYVRQGTNAQNPW